MSRDAETLRRFVACVESVLRAEGVAPATVGRVVNVLLCGEPAGGWVQHLNREADRLVRESFDGVEPDPAVPGPGTAVHICDERCICRIHRTALYYASRINRHACQEPDCKYANGGLTAVPWDEGYARGSVEAVQPSAGVGDGKTSAADR